MGNQLKKRLQRKVKAEQEEIETQVKVGVVTKAPKIGRWKYKQRKDDFQLEEDLAGNLRQIKPVGNDTLLQERFDGIFRRNMVELDAPTMQEKKRQRKVQYKMYQKVGTKARELHEANQELKRQNDMKEKSFKKQKNDDMIMI